MAQLQIEFLAVSERDSTGQGVIVAGVMVRSMRRASGLAREHQERESAIGEANFIAITQARRPANLVAVHQRAIL